jgi:hypothetical protein
MMSPWLSFTISVLALCVSGITAWLTLFRKGALKMTHPTALAFIPGGTENKGHSQVLLRTLFYSTSKRGQIIESLHISIRRGESKQNFSVWVYGEKEDLKRGSGLFVPQEGVAYDHYFLLPKDSAGFAFLTGEYSISIFAKIAGTDTPMELTMINLHVNDAQSIALRESSCRLHFDWGPDRQNYHPHLVARSKNPFPMDDDLFDLLGFVGRKS